MRRVWKFKDALRHITGSSELDIDKIYDLDYFKLMFSNKEIMQKCIEPLFNLNAEVLVNVKGRDKDNIVQLKISIRCEFVNYETIMTSHDYYQYFDKLDIFNMNLIKS